MIKLHLGCGKRDFGQDWIHIDGGNFPHVSSHDIINLPFEKGSVDLIYNCHVFEYFDRFEAVEVLSKWKSYLKEGGVLRIAVPDFESMAGYYLYLKQMKINNPLNNFIGPLYGKWKMNNKSIYHKTVYDFESLKEMLEAVGFKNVRKYDWRKTEHSNFDDHSQSYLPHMDKENGMLMSLNVEATK